MQLQDDIDFTTLNWVKQELDETLKQARQALESFVEDPADASLMRFCATYLHQVQGTLRMVELYGAAMVVEEMERLAVALLDNQVRQREDAYAVLMRGIVQLPDYLERLQGGHKDIPIVLLPLLNDLRACRGEKLLSESVLFSPDLNVVLPERAHPVQPLAEPEVRKQVARLRTHFQVALLRWFRNPKSTEAANSLIGILERVGDVAAQPEARRAWEAAAGLLDAVAVGGIEASATVKLLFGRIDREIKRLADIGEAGFGAEPPKELVKNLLYYVAHTATETDRTRQLKQVYRLDQLLPTQKELDHAKGSLGGKNRALLDTVAFAIKEDLMRVKDALDLHLRTTDAKPVDLLAQTEVLDRVADTLGMLGLGVPRRVVQEQRQAITDIVSSGKPVDEGPLLDIAGALLYVEASLDDNINSLGASAESGASVAKASSEAELPQAEVRKILETLIKEAGINLQQAKQDIVAFVEAPWDHEKMAQIPRLLLEIMGAMKMLALDEVAQLLQALRYFVEVELIGSRRVPTAEQMDRIADAFASIEYYLESVRDQRAGRENILAVTKRSLASLGYWPLPELIERLSRSELDELAGAAIEQAVAGTPATQAAPIPPPAEASGVLPMGADALELSSAVEIETGFDAVGAHETHPASSEPSAAVHEPPTSITAPVAPAKPVDAAVPPSEADFEWVEIEEEVEEELPALGAALPAGTFQAATSDDIDDEIREVFVEEVQDEINNIHANLPPWKSNIEDLDKLKAVRRSFHTLKGSGRLVGALALGEFSWKIENMLNRVLDGTIPASAELIGLLDQAVAALPQLLAALRNEGTPSMDLAGIMHNAERLASGQPVVDTGARKTKVKRRRWVQVPKQPQVGEGAPVDERHADAPVAVPDVELTARVAADAAAQSEFDPMLLEILRSEAQGHIQVLDDYLARCRQQGQPLLVTEDVLRSVHTLHGAVSMADVPTINDLVGPLEGYIKRLRASALAPSDRGLQAIVQARDCIVQALALLDQPAGTLADVQETVIALSELRDALPEPESAYPVFALDMDDDEIEATQLDQGAPEALDVAQPGVDYEADVIIETLELATPADATDGEPSPGVAQSAVSEVHAAREPIVASLGGDKAPDAAIPAIAEDVEPEGALVLDDVDQDLIEIFVEEGRDILDQADASVARLRQPAQESEAIQALQRHLHTLKGNARAVNVNVVGDLCHAMESLLEEIVSERHKLSPISLDALERGFDALHRMVERVANRQALGAPRHLIARFEALVNGTPITEAPVASAAPAAAQPQAPASAPVPELTPEPAVAAKPFEPVAAAAPLPPREAPLPPAVVEEPAARAPQEMIRVRSDLLDALVNFAGEVSIYRSRLEQQIGSFRFNLVELNQTVERLRDQLRKLEIETEAQILSRYQREAASGGEQFDPLELDRFSTQQQLSRALAESVSDLQALQGALDDLTRQSETLLLQQSRVSSELQEGLMRTRMVPFDSIVPFLRRLVRQTADELGKRASLRIEGAQGEMDRNLLERMKAPFEHMLRNALAHGIEAPAARLSAGKPAEGSIRITVSREATEVLIRVSDDGQGMDRDAIQRKAIERGLMRPDAQLSDQDLFAFITETGFSTAEQVTKIAGRGVGMDVVASEIKQLGGSLTIGSQRGLGTEFAIRLPFTLAVTQAILVRLGDQTYAIPMSSIQGVARIGREDLTVRLRQPQPVFLYAGETYAIHELDTLLGGVSQRATDDAQVPLLLTRSGDQRGAVRVDAVLGSREVVVKSAGPQVSSVPGIFGATIMGDGSVVLILDLAPLIRRSLALRAEDAGQQVPEVSDAPPVTAVPEALPHARTQPLVMVVDDSITMRKVTSRVLERNDMEVVTAKDGLDAIEKLQERLPDLMLLDIEMPRMDGYELATHMKNDPRLARIPIIMITSRTGEKHRQRALEIGVERYLGKPYQEAELLKNVEETLGLDRALH